MAHRTEWRGGGFPAWGRADDGSEGGQGSRVAWGQRWLGSSELTEGDSVRSAVFLILPQA